MSILSFFILYGTQVMTEFFSTCNKSTVSECDTPTNSDSLFSSLGWKLRQHLFVIQPWNLFFFQKNCFWRNEKNLFKFAAQNELIFLRDILLNLFWVSGNKIMKTKKCLVDRKQETAKVFSSTAQANIDFSFVEMGK